jgi:hypothetical protein
MKMGKLTNYSREKIVRAVLQHRFAEAVAALVAERAAFAKAVYEDIYQLGDRRKMANLPKGWLPEVETIGVQFGDGRSYHALSFSGAEYGSQAKMLAKSIEGLSRRVIHSHSRGCAKVYEVTDHLSVTYRALKERSADLTKQIDDAERQTIAAINSASTVNRLIEIWPEVAPFAIKFDPAPVPLPVLPTKKLNALLDLPVTETA